MRQKPVSRLQRTTGITAAFALGCRGGHRIFRTELKFESVIEQGVGVAQVELPGQVVVTLIQDRGRQWQAIGFDDVVLRRRIGGIEQVARDVVLVGLNPEPALNFMLAEIVGQ